MKIKKIKIKKPKKIKVKKIRKVKAFKPKSIISGLLNKTRLYISSSRSPKSLLSRVVIDVFSGITKLSTDWLSPVGIYKNMNQKYGKDWIELSPIAFREDSFGSNVDKVLALKTLLRTDAYFNDPFVFEKITIAFNDIPISKTAYQELLPDQIAYSLIQAHIFRDEMVMSEDVEVFIVMQLLDSGFPIFLWPFDIENDTIPDEAYEITNRIKEWIDNSAEDIDEDLNVYLEKYFDLLDILNNKIKEDSDSLVELKSKRR